RTRHTRYEMPPTLSSWPDRHGRDHDQARRVPGRAPPARLDRTVGTSSYPFSVITRATAAEPAPGRSRPPPEVGFVLVDVETTGWTPGVARITEIGAVKISAGHQLGQFSSLVNPGGAIPERVAALTGISDEMVAVAPPLADVLPAFLAFARGCVLTAHN